MPDRPRDTAAPARAVNPSAKTTPMHTPPPVPAVGPPPPVVVCESCGLTAGEDALDRWLMHRPAAGRESRFGVCPGCLAALVATPKPLVAPPAPGRGAP